MSYQRSRRAGFTLLELSLVVVIIAVVMAGGFSMSQGMIESARRVSTNNKLDTIEDALYAFRANNNRLPCPADVTATIGSATFGVEAATPGTCTGGSPAANFTVSGGSTVDGNLLEGGVPTKALNLPDEFATDAWGRKIAYGVWDKLTGTDAFSSYQIAQNCGGITVKDAGGGTRTSKGDYVLVSYGPDGHGGYLPASGTRMNAASVNTNTQTNCHCDASAANTAYAASYVQMDATQNAANSLDKFDDLVRDKERWQLQTSDDVYASGGSMCHTSPGFRIDGVAASGETGYSLATGDINGDGIADLVIGAPYGNGNRGYVYIIFGSASGFSSPFDLSSLNGTNGFRLDGVTAGDMAGLTVATGDINGDGKADIIIGAYNANGANGYVYVVFGKAGSRAANTVLNTGAGNLIDGTQGFRLDGVLAGFRVGGSLAAGDINGDGLPDLVVGTSNVRSSPGYTYVVFGKSSGWGATTQLNTGAGNLIDGTKGFRLDGVTANDYAGSALAVGDVNGDNKSDLIIGAYNANSAGGYVYVVFGKAGSWAASTVLNTGAGNIIDGTQGARIDSESTSDGAGLSVAAGDVNADGKADLIIGAYRAHAGAASGYTYVVFGKASGWATTQVLNTGPGNLIDGTQGFRLDGVASSDNIGYKVAAADVNGDGKADIITASPWVNSFRGYTYVVFGKASGWSATTVLNTGAGNIIDGTQGARFDGVNGMDLSGWSAATGDINGDGKTDVIIGAYNANSKGAIYVYFGKASGWPTTYSLGGL
jgi:prepilin-type N-terminal cleavage/methylation domain-containing protein